MGGGPRDLFHIISTVIYDGINGLRTWPALLKPPPAPGDDSPTAACPASIFPKHAGHSAAVYQRRGATRVPAWAGGPPCQTLPHAQATAGRVAWRAVTTLFLRNLPLAERRQAGGSGLAVAAAQRAQPPGPVLLGVAPIPGVGTGRATRKAAEDLIQLRLSIPTAGTPPHCLARAELGAHPARRVCETEEKGEGMAACETPHPTCHPTCPTFRCPWMTWVPGQQPPPSLLSSKNRQFGRVTKPQWRVGVFLYHEGPWREGKDKACLREDAWCGTAFRRGLWAPGGLPLRSHAFEPSQKTWEGTTAQAGDLLTAHLLASWVCAHCPKTGMDGVGVANLQSSYQ